MLAWVPLFVILGQLAVEPQNACARVPELISAREFRVAMMPEPNATCRAQVAAGQRPNVVSPARL